MAYSRGDGAGFEPRSALTPSLLFFVFAISSVSSRVTFKDPESHESHVVCKQFYYSVHHIHVTCNSHSLNILVLIDNVMGIYVKVIVHQGYNVNCSRE